MNKNKYNNRIVVFEEGFSKAELRNLEVSQKSQEIPMTY